MKKLILLLALTFTFSACSDPLDKKFNDKTALSDVENLKANKNITSEEAKIILTYAAISKIRGSNIETLTYRNILDSVRIYRENKENEKLKEKINTEKRGKYVEGYIIHKEYDEYKYRKYINFQISLLNKSSKEIRGVKGTFVFTDIFGDEIYRVSITYDEGISANFKIHYEASIRYNEFENSHITLLTTDLTDMSIEWIPEKIVFSDGTII